MVVITVQLMFSSAEREVASIGLGHQMFVIVEEREKETLYLIVYRCLPISFIHDYANVV